MYEKDILTLGYFYGLFHSSFQMFQGIEIVNKSPEKNSKLLLLLDIE